MAPRLHVIVASTRPGRLGISVARWFDGFARRHGGFETVLVDLADFGLPVFDEPKHPLARQYQHEHTKRWSESVAPRTPTPSSCRSTTTSRPPPS